MKSFSDQRCFVHPRREAVCLCTACRNPHCRECVTDERGRLMCAACSRRAQAATHQSRRHLMVVVAGPASVLLALAIAWVFFYSIGRGLLLFSPVASSFAEAPEGDVR